MADKDYDADKSWRDRLPPGKFGISTLKTEVAHQSALREELAYLDDTPKTPAEGGAKPAKKRRIRNPDSRR